jgi:DNA-binding transcriptional LysR family regulator
MFPRASRKSNPAGSASPRRAATLNRSGSGQRSTNTSSPPGFNTLAVEDDVFALVPGALARHLGDRGVPVRWHDVPLELPSVTVHLRWHRRMDGDRPSQWLRVHIAECLKDFAAE